MANKQSSKDLRKVREQLDHFLDESVREQVEVILPVSLKKSFLLEHTPTGVKESRWLGFAYYIVSRVLRLTLDEKYKLTKAGAKKSKSWVSLSSVIFQEVGQKAYTVMRDTLIRLQVLECDGEHSRKEYRTYGYRLGKKHRNQPIKVRSITDNAIRKLIVEQRRSEIEKQKPRLRSLAHVAQWWLKYESIELDKEAAIEFLDLYRPIMQRRLEKRLSSTVYSEKSKDELRGRAERGFLYAEHQVKQWGKRPNLAVDEKGGRFYTPLVSLSSPLRHFVTYKGQPLVSFDIKNSQPLHLLFLLKNDFWLSTSRKSWSLRKLDDNLWEEVRAQLERSTQDKELTSRLMLLMSPSIDLGKRRQFTDLECVENAHFAQLVLDGKLYEFKLAEFKNRYFDKLGKDRFGTRGLAKQEVLKLMYFDLNNPHSSSQEPFQHFSRLFPDVAYIMELLKCRDYRDFPVLLQKLEAQILLHNVCRNIYDQHSTTWFATVHDSIITTAEHAAQVETIILSTYRRILGAEPQLERTPLNPDTPFKELSRYVDTKLDKELGAEENVTGSGLTLGEIRRRLLERSTPTNNSVETLSFDLGIVGVSAMLAYGAEQIHNPFEQPPRKLKK